MISGIGSMTQVTEKLNASKDADKAGQFEEALSQATGSKDQEALKEACMEVEQYMLSQIFKQMRASINSEDGLIPKGDYEKMVEDYLVDEQCKTICESGGLGLGEMMYKQMLQEL